MVEVMAKSAARAMGGGFARNVLGTILGGLRRR
jgi:hypothetical protein